MIENVRKDLINIIKMLDDEIENELKNKDKDYDNTLNKFLNQYSRKYLIDINLLRREYTLYVVPF